MKCPRCEAENSSSAAFCDECGARLESPCPNCGEPNRRDAKFCRHCGQVLNQTQSAPESTASAIAQYVPKHLAEKIRASQHTLEGERKRVTVLFADIRGSTKLLEGLDPEKGQKIIDPVVRVMMDAVHRYEGTVNQVLGDGIMAIFGAPLAHEDHALRACYAALAMQEEMRRYREKTDQSEAMGPQIGIGMNTGEVVVRSIDNDLNLDYSALGHTTHLAARMQELASGGTSLMTASTMREVEGFVQVKSLGGVNVKGVSRPIDTFELIGATSARTRVQAGAIRGLTPLVGRQSEVEIFRKVVEHTASRRGQILAMVGEPGMGKSRLVHEFSRHQLPQGWLVLEGSSVSYGRATPYFPLIEMLRRYFQISDRYGMDQIQDQVVTQILELDNVLKDTIPAILALLGALPNKAPPSSAFTRFKELDDAVERYMAIDPQQRRRQTLDGLKRVLIRESQRQPLLIVFEDLHWIDSETQACLDGLIESLPTTRVLLLVDYRPEYNHGWADKTYYTQIRVDPLNPTSTEELLQHLLGRHRDLGPLTQMLMQRTEGNPFFAEESVRSLVETGILIGDKGAYRPGLTIDKIQLPGTVQNVVADRIDRLPVEEKRVLQTAAVIGPIIPLSLLEAVADVDAEDLRRYISHLQTAEFLYETNLFPELEYSFKHAITGEVAYGELLHERKTQLHAKIVNALERTAADHLRDKVETLAHHAFYGELWEKAVFYLKEAGAKAASRSSFRHAVLWYEQALDALRQLPTELNTLRDAVDIRINIRNALFVLGDFQKGIQCLDEAKQAAVALKDEARLGTIYNLMTAHWNLAGNSERAIVSAKEALNHTQAPAHINLNIVAHYFLGVAHHNLGQYEEAVDVLGRALPLIGNRKSELFGTTGSVYVIARAWLARGLGQLGKFDEAIPHVDSAMSAAEESSHPYSIAYAYYAAGILFFLKGDFEHAITLLERGLAVCDAADIVVQRPLVAACLGAALPFVGRFDEAHRLLEESVEHTASMRRLAGQAMRVAWLSGAYMLAGRTDEADALAKRGLQLTAESKDKGSEAWLLAILADLSARRRPFNPAQVESDYGVALALARELKMRPLQAHCHLGMGNLYAQVKNLSRARSELSAAANLYDAMSMPYWLAKARGALARFDE
jgi:class 3 adenylate cyclase/tetratricopeptide (TPR) repeat protein